MCGAVGQLFIFGTIKTFGSLVNTLITTTRKFFNILLSGVSAMVKLLGCRCLERVVQLLSTAAVAPPAKSWHKWINCQLQASPSHSRHRHLLSLGAVLWNANPLLPQQWGAVALVFSGLLVSTWTKSRRHSAPYQAARVKRH